MHANRYDLRLPWVLVASASRARLYKRDPDTGALIELADFVRPTGPVEAGAFGPDRPAGVAGGDGAALASVTPLRPRQRDRFAQELAAILDSSVAEQALDSWTLVAASPFLGVLHAALGRPAATMLSRCIDRDLSTCTGLELERRLSAVLEASPRRDRPAAAAD